MMIMLLKVKKTMELYKSKEDSLKKMAVRVPINCLRRNLMDLVILDYKF